MTTHGSLRPAGVPDPQHLERIRVDKERHGLWLMGMDYDAIAAIMACTPAEAAASVHLMFRRMSPREVADARNQHYMGRVHHEFDSLTLDALRHLLEGREDGWKQKVKGLEHFRKILGLDAGSGNVQVNVKQQTAVIGGAGDVTTFEALLGRVKANVFASDEDVRDVRPILNGSESGSERDE